MSRKLNSFILSDNIIKKMNDKIEETKIKNIEIGFSLCKEKTKDILKIGNECIGTQCVIQRPPQRCKEKDEYQGLFHTHPSGEISPSLGDIINIYEDGIGCIGSPRENKIKCVVRKGPKEENILREFHIARIRFEIMGVGTVEEYEKTIHELSNKYFNEIEVK